MSIIFFLFILGLLSKSELSNFYASTALDLWFHKMIPALLPFMILSGLIVRIGYAEKIASWFAPILGKIFCASKTACYVIVVGFLCGFPMGARTVAQLYSGKKLTKNEALWLLAFCNNIGPVYFCSFALPLLGLKYPIICLIGMYGIPLLYGFIARKYIYKFGRKPEIVNSSGTVSLGDALEYSIYSGIKNIAMLGGYMILFCMLNLVPHLIGIGQCPLLSVFLEITSGLIFIKGQFPLYCLCGLMFGGVSCIAQTYSSLKETDLCEHIFEYVIHKLILTILLLLYYGVMYYLISDLFG